MAALNILDRERTVADAGYNRWLIPPAALAVHLSIGEVYAFSVFNGPLEQYGGWSQTTIGWIFSLSIVFLGLSAAFGGKWVERAGPRKAMLVSALFFGGGFLVSAVGLAVSQIWLLYLGYGVLGGTGLGIGYISPVKTLITWFPDRPGMATGLAIMGFGGGALIGSPLSVGLMSLFGGGNAAAGILATFVALGVIYFAFMMFGVFLVRVPPEGWLPEGYEAPAEDDAALITTANVVADEAIKTRQFWQLWIVLFVNVTAGISVLAQASLFIQESFGVAAGAAAGFVGLLSLFNMVGRFGWSSLSDKIGRKWTYVLFLGIGAGLYLLVPLASALGSIVLFVILFAMIISMYGGGFATIPAYLRDMFGTREVGAIHGRVLTAWSAAGIAGPALINYLRAFNQSQGITGADQYDITMYVMAALLAVGFVANLLMKPVDPKHHASETSPRPTEAEPTRTGGARSSGAARPNARPADA